MIYFNIKVDEISIVFRKNDGAAAEPCEQIRFSHVHDTMMRAFIIPITFHFTFRKARKKLRKKKRNYLLIPQ